MAFKPAGYIRTTLPVDFSVLDDLDSGRYHSIWMADHLVSLWPDSIWTPEFTDLATVNPSPHRHLDGLAMAAAVAALTKNTPIATSVVDTARRHPAMLAQTALTISHISKGRFILGLGSGEMENVVPYGFDFSRPVARFEEALQVIRLLWERQGPVDFDGQFFHLHHARLDTEPYGGKVPPIWIGCCGPRMLSIAGRQADGWWPVGTITIDDYARMLGQLHEHAERAGRDPAAIAKAGFLTCLIGDEGEIAEMIRQPLVKAFLLQVRGDFLKAQGFIHPMGEGWKGIHDIDPRVLTRERILRFLDDVEPGAVLAALPHGTPRRIAQIAKGYVDAGMQAPKILDYGGMAGLAFGAKSAAKVREAEDALIAMMDGAA